MRTGKHNTEHPRVRFARMELEKLLCAVEAINGDELNAAMRVIELERQVEEEREIGRHWRKCYESMRGILVNVGPNGDLDRLDQIMREWAGRAG